jgi:hypothetical protein
MTLDIHRNKRHRQQHRKQNNLHHYPTPKKGVKLVNRSTMVMSYHVALRCISRFNAS